jgi:signal transduction histidine kinase
LNNSTVNVSLQKAKPALERLRILAVIWLMVIAPLTYAQSEGSNDLSNTNSFGIALPNMAEFPPPGYANRMTNGLGSWIWGPEVFDRQSCQFWRSFDIPADVVVTQAILLITADNEYTLYLDGRELGRGAEWRHVGEYTLTGLLSPGHHILAVKAFNSSNFAGLIAGLRILLSDGRVIHVKTDSTWKLVPNDASRWTTRSDAPPSWPAVSIVGYLGLGPWWKSPDAIEMIPPLLPVTTYFWQTTWFQVVLLIICCLVILFSLRLMAQLALHRKERWLLRRERERIARDIHDDLGSRMTQLVLHGEVAQSELPPDSESRQQIERLCEDARKVLDTIDEILWAVNPRRDTLRDFVSYVCDYAEEYLKPTNIKYYLEVDPEIATVTLDLPFRRSLLMAVKETLNNAVKYSEASELQLKIHRNAQMLVVSVKDNGKGFDKLNVRPGRNGLANMSNRLDELGGRCRIETEPGKGCSVEFIVPLSHSEEKAKFWEWSSRGFPWRAGDTHHPHRHGKL